MRGTFLRFTWPGKYRMQRVPAKVINYIKVFKQFCFFYSFSFRFIQEKDATGLIHSWNASGMISYRDVLTVWCDDLIQGRNILIVIMLLESMEKPSFTILAKGF